MADSYKQSQTHTHPLQHQTESVMSVVEGVDTALSTNMLISYATEILHPSALLEMGHNVAMAKFTGHTHDNTLMHNFVHLVTISTCMNVFATLHKLSQ